MCYKQCLKVNKVTGQLEKFDSKWTKEEEHNVAKVPRVDGY